MKLKAKVKILVIGLLIVALAVPMGTALYFTIRDKQRDIRTFAESEIARMKRALQDNLDIAFETMKSNYAEATSEQNLERVFGEPMKDLVDVFFCLINAEIRKAEAGEQSMEQAKANVIEETRKLRIGKFDSYFWIQDDALPVPSMIMHPTVPSLNGRLLEDPSYNTVGSQARNLFVVAAERCRAAGEGYIRYLWGKPLADGTSVPNVPKFSYVRAIPQWNWVLGTGVYMDDAFREGIERLKAEIGRLRYNNGNSFFWIHDDEGTLILHPNAAAVGRKVVAEPAFSFVDKGLEAIRGKSGYGFIEFEDATDAQGPKSRRIGIVKRFEGLNWIIGTSIDREVMEKTILWKEQRMAKQVRNTIIGIAVFFGLMLLLATWSINLALGRFGLIELNPGDHGKPSEQQKDDQDEQEEAEEQEPALVPHADLLRTLKEITTHTISEQARLLAFQHACGNAAFPSDCPELREEVHSLGAEVAKLEGMLRDALETSRSGQQQELTNLRESLERLHQTLDKNRK